MSFKVNNFSALNSHTAETTTPCPGVNCHQPPCVEGTESLSCPDELFFVFGLVFFFVFRDQTEKSDTLSSFQSGLYPQRGGSKMKEGTRWPESQGSNGVKPKLRDSCHSNDTHTQTLCVHKCVFVYRKWERENESSIYPTNSLHEALFSRGPWDHFCHSPVINTLPGDELLQR